MPRRLVVATFNLHAGMDGYGRRFDVVEACRPLEADVLILEEIFAPAGGVGQADEIGEALGYRRVELPLARAWRTIHELPAPPGAGWEPRRPYPRERRALRVGSYLKTPRSGAGYEEGSWGLAVLTREPVVASEVIELGRLTRDYTSRAALSVTLEGGLRVVAVHMPHLTHGSPVHFHRLQSALRPLVRGRWHAVLGGDMNYWGPPLELALQGWRRAVKAKTWPAWRPRHQLDHLFVSRDVRAVGGGVVRSGNSDHLPLRATIEL
ncbi:MAG TPA: endonuclease/exonuclease/phosphatase family protein, partial [Acidimicrobiales bacterium]|nr:endonuclease/exonuclease/phosphatase family protein [Acidimicrobiales bacterium]